MTRLCAVLAVLSFVGCGSDPNKTATGADSASADGGDGSTADGGDAGGGSGDGGNAGDGDSGGDAGDGGDSGGDGGDGEQWAVISGIYGSQYAEGVAVTASGDVVFGGSYENGIDLGDGGFASRGRDDALVGQVSGADGTLDWNISTGDGGTEVVYDVAVAPDGAVYAVGWFEDDLAFPDVTLTARGDYDGFIARWEADGTHTWATRLGGSGDDRMRAVAADLSGPCVAGFTEDGLTGTGLPLSASSLLDGVVVCLDPAGVPVWGAVVGFGSGTAPALAVAVGEDGVRAGGYFTGTVDLGAGRVDSLGGRDAWLMRWSRSGEDARGRIFGATGDQELHGLGLVGTETVAVGMWAGGDLSVGGGGTPVGASDGVWIRTDADLAPLDAGLISGDGAEVALDVAVGPEGDLAVTGFADGTLTLSVDHAPLGDRDIWLGVWSEGAWSRSARLGGEGEDVGRSVAWHPSGDLVLGGTSAGQCEIGGTALEGYGDRDFLLARVSL